MASRGVDFGKTLPGGIWAALRSPARVDTEEDAQTETETTEQTQSETGKPEDNPSHPNYTGRPPNGTFKKLARLWDEKHTAQEAQGKNGDKMPDV